jgi:hypothetical protein
MRATVFAEVLRPEPMTLEVWADVDEDEDETAKSGEQ